VLFRLRAFVAIVGSGLRVLAATLAPAAVSGVAAGASAGRTRRSIDGYVYAAAAGATDVLRAAASAAEGFAASLPAAFSGLAANFIIRAVWGADFYVVAI